MRFPWQARQTVRILPDRLNGEAQPWCRDARLVYVDGAGVLRWEDRGPAEKPTVCEGRLLSLTLRGTPLLSRQSPGCPTCESLLAAGWGLDTADCPELEAVREILNGGFIRLEDAVSGLAPLLGLLEPGLYVIADGDACPADGGGRFFWDVPDALSAAPATGLVGLTDNDFDYEYPELPPVFLYPSQRRSRFDPDREAYYEEQLRQDGPPPRALALHCLEGVSLLLDGHHKAAAAARLGRTVPCLTILPLSGYSYQTSPGAVRRKAVRDRVFFGPLSLPAAELPDKWLSASPRNLRQGPQGERPVGRLADREWPAGYRAAGASYPTARECALVTAAEIGYPTDEDLGRWLAEPWLHRRELRAALVLLRTSGDPRLKAAALRCADLPGGWCSLKEDSFRVLAGMREDRDAENFFVDYFINSEALSQDRPQGADILTEIAHSFWN